MKTRFHFGKPILKIIEFVFANLLLALIVTMLVFKGFSGSVSHFLTSLVWSFVICITQWLGHGYIHDWLDKKYSWHEHLIKRAIFTAFYLLIMLFKILGCQFQKLLLK